MFLLLPDDVTGVFNQDKMQQKNKSSPRRALGPTWGQSTFVGTRAPVAAKAIIITEFPAYLLPGNNKVISTSFGKRYL